MVCRHTPLVAVIKASFVQTIVILHANGVMAFPQILAEDVLQNVFEDEQSLDNSDSKNGKDICGYLGAFVVLHGELEDKSRRLSRRRLLDVDGGDDEESSEDENEFNGDFDTQFDEPSLMECDNDGRGKIDATGRASVED